MRNALLCGGEGGPLAGEPGPYDEYVVGWHGADAIERKSDHVVGMRLMHHTAQTRPPGGQGRRRIVASYLYFAYGLSTCFT